MDGKITINVPNDLKKISRKKYIIRLSLLIAVYMVEVILFAVYYDKFMSAIPSYTMLNIFGMILIPAIVILFPLKKDRSWIGEIYDYKLSELAAYSSRVAHPISYLGEKSRIQIRLRNGKEVFDRIYDCYLHTDDPPSDTFCRRENIAVHIFGTKYPTVVPEKEGDKSICVVCGLINSEAFYKCDRCGHTLIKKDNILII